MASQVQVSDKIKTRVERVKLATLKLLPINARYMRHETYQTLVANIARDGCLTSVPFACLDDDGRYLVLSGNHRVQAAIEAGLIEGDVMLTDSPMPEQRRTAMQLSHNALVGEDDPELLKRLYDGLDRDWRIASGLDDKTLDLLADVGTLSLSEPTLDFQHVTFAFLPDEVDRIKAAWETAMDLIPPGAIIFGRMKEYDRAMEALRLAKNSYKLSISTIGLMVILDIFEKHVTDLQDGWYDHLGRKPRHSGWIPDATLFGVDSMPPQAAQVVKSAIDAMVSRGEVSPDSLWKAVEYWAADYLAGAGEEETP